MKIKNIWNHHPAIQWTHNERITKTGPRVPNGWKLRNPSILPFVLGAKLFEQAGECHHTSWLLHFLVGLDVFFEEKWAAIGSWDCDDCVTGSYCLQRGMLAKARAAVTSQTHPQQQQAPPPAAPAAQENGPSFPLHSSSLSKWPFWAVPQMA